VKRRAIQAIAGGYALAGAALACAALAGAALARGRAGISLALAGLLAATAAPLLRRARRRLTVAEAGRRHLSTLLGERSAQLERSTRALADHARELQSAHSHLVVCEWLTTLGRLTTSNVQAMRDPLAVAVTNLTWLQEKLPSFLDGDPATGELMAALGEAASSTERVTSLVRDLQSVSDERARTPGATDLATVLRLVQRLTASEVVPRTRFSLELPDESLKVAGTTAHLGQLFANLVLLATGRVDGERAEDNEVRVVVRAGDGGRAEVELHDTGRPGARAGRHELDPFGPGSAGRHRDALGLAVCRRVVAALGGEIESERAPAGGGLLRITLPLAPHRSSEAAGGASSRPRVLVVDDEPLVCASLYRVLSRHFDVVPQTSPRRALAMIRAGERFEAVLCDLLMPEMSGSSFHRELRRLDGDLAARTVFLTGGAFMPDAREFLESVANARIQKPFEPAELVAVISERCRPGAGASTNLGL